MSIIVTGSIAWDYLMRFPGYFKDHILAGDKISVSFLVDEKERHRGGTAPNIAYNLALLGERPKIVGAAGLDFEDYKSWLERVGVDTSLISVHPDEFTATFSVITDLDQNQIASFHTGAMARAREIDLRDVGGSGKVLWRKRVGGNFFSSPVCADGKLFGVSTTGQVVVLAAKEQFALLGRTELGEQCHATPAIANGTIYFRTLTHVHCLPGNRAPSHTALPAHHPVSASLSTSRQKSENTPGREFSSQRERKSAYAGPVT